MSASSYSWCMYSHKVNIIGCMYIYVYTNKYFVTCRMPACSAIFKDKVKPGTVATHTTQEAWYVAETPVCPLCSGDHWSSAGAG